MKKITEYLTFFGLFLSGIFFGGMRVYSVFWVFLYFLAVFFLALFSGDAQENLKKTFRFPVFWLGLIFCAYIFLQDINPWINFYGRLEGVYYRPLDFYSLLPSGVNGLHVNSFSSYFIILMAMLLTVAASTINLVVNDFRSCIKCVLAIALGGACCALMGIIISFLFPENRLYVSGIFYMGDSGGYASFYLRSQACALIILGMGALFAYCGYFLYTCYEEGSRKVFLYVFAVAFAAISLLGITLSQAFGALILGFGFVLLSALWILAISLFRDFSKSKLILFLGAILLPFVFAALLYVRPETFGDRAKSKVDAILGRDPATLDAYGSRGYFRKMTLQMIYEGGAFDKTSFEAMPLASKIFFGNGANSYGDISAHYIKREPRFISRHDRYFQDPNKVYRILTYAHCDFLQLIFEYGILWFCVFLCLLIYWFKTLWRARFWKSPFLFSIFFAIFTVFLYAANDIILYNSFVSLNILALALVSLKYANLKIADMQKNAK